MKTVHFLLGLLVAIGLTQSAGFDLAGKQEGVILTSLASPNSVYSVALSRANAMAGMTGVSVPMDRNTSPAAWYVIPRFGLNGHDVVTTTFPSWLGTSPGLFPQEVGHSIVHHVAGKFPVSAYSLRVTPDTALVNGDEFPVGVKSRTGEEILFGPNFIGVAFGVNGVMDSKVVNGVFVKAGDDSVFNSGQSPSAVTYDVWFRFGSRTVVNITDPSGFGSFFGLPWSLTAELKRSGVVVATATVSTAELAPAHLEITKTGTNVTLTIIGGGSALYNVRTNSAIGGTQGVHKTGLASGATFTEAPSGLAGYYSLVKKSGAALASANHDRSRVVLVTTNGDDDD
ncbi:MAG: hypothetical protein Q7S72_00780 [Candidatus Taylorbacteria bacterium]|nr:hypothetical protein [Candidatus Taylorbacteria bacterium]